MLRIVVPRRAFSRLSPLSPLQSLFVGFLAISLWGCSTFRGDDPEKANLFLRLGTSQIEAGDYPSALRSLLESERLNPNNEVTQNNLGLLYFLRDRLDSAEEHVRKAIRLKPQYSDAKNNLARILVEAGRPEEALIVLEQVNRDLTYDRPAKALLNMGLAYFKLKDYGKAREYFTKTLKYGRDNCLAQSYLGRTYFEASDYKKAAEVLDGAVSFCKALQYDEPHYYAALAYYEIGEKSKAEIRLEDVVKIYVRGKYQDQAKSLLETIRR